FSQFSFVSDGDKTLNRPIVGGERKQFGESMSSEIAKVLGLDYEKLRVAAVVQQGEIVRLVEAQPKEFKELLNGLIGIDRLDSAYETMRDVIVGFATGCGTKQAIQTRNCPRWKRLCARKRSSLNSPSLCRQ